MKLRLLLACALACAPLLAGTACRQELRADERGKVRVGIVFDIGGKDDRSFNAAAYDGVKCAETGRHPDGTPCDDKHPSLGIMLRDVEPGNPTSIEPAMRAFAERGYDLIIGVGFAQAPIMEIVAKDYPGINFAIVDGASQMPNVASLVFKEHEGSYLVGMIAAKESKTGVLGFIGGMDIGLIHRFAKGYEEGAKAARPDAQVIVNYVGVTDGAWNNPGKGKELALAQIGKGADVIFTAAGNSGLGAFDAVEQAGRDAGGRANRFVIGVDSNQNGVKPGFVLTSMVKRVDQAVFATVKDVKDGSFSGGPKSYDL
ncbi:MAG TPA: BMP family ABC transporter substrate-binding protein, partial [Pyrinomonadaceae bacterium]